MLTVRICIARRCIIIDKHIRMFVSMMLVSFFSGRETDVPELWVCVRGEVEVLVATRGLQVLTPVTMDTISSDVPLSVCVCVWG